MTRVTVGDVEIVALSDGPGVFPATRVFPNAGDALVRYAHLLDAEGNIHQNFGSFLLRADGRTVLVDTGNGPEREGRLMRELDSAGVRTDEIDTVIFTHLHGDHTGWNLQREDGKPRFSRARYLVPKGDWDHGIAQNREGGSFNRDIRPLEALGVLDLIEGERPISPSLTTLPTPGHTPGHTTIVVRSGGAEAYILGDAFLSPIDVAEMDWATSWDGDAETTVRTRHMLAARIEAADALVGASHLPAPGLGHFVVVGGRRAWRGVSLVG
jgi:glyoxylase-like metal-dependent hydrolase (beta-lactamase superfamily II)